MNIKKSVQNFSRNVNKNLQVIHEGKETRAAARYAFKCAGRFFLHRTTDVWLYQEWKNMHFARQGVWNTFSPAIVRLQDERIAKCGTLRFLRKQKCPCGHVICIVCKNIGNSLYYKLRFFYIMPFWQIQSKG